MQTHFLIATLLLVMTSHAVAGDATLDPSFGSGGKVRLAGQTINRGVFGATVATDVVVQPDGKILFCGYYSFAVEGGTTQYQWTVTRLDSDGSLDPTFGLNGSGTAYSEFGFVPAVQALSIALRPNGKILVGGNMDNGVQETAVVVQLNSDGTTDTNFGSAGGVRITPGSNESSQLRRMKLGVDGNIGIAGSYTHSNGNSDFLFALIAADGNGGGIPYETIIQETSQGGTLSDSATDLAQDKNGNWVVGGYYSTGTGLVDCDAIRVQATFPLSLDLTYGNPGSGIARTGMNVDLAGNQQGFCDSLTITPAGGVVLGGHAPVATSGNSTYEAAALAWLDNTGTLVKFGLNQAALRFFDYSGNSLLANDNNTVNRLLVQDYDSRLIVAGFHNDAHYLPLSGDDFAFDRFIVNHTNGMLPDDSLNAGAGVRVDWGSIGGLHPYQSNERINSATFDTQRRLVVVGYSNESSGQPDMAIARFQPFDGIFKATYEAPEY